METIEMEKFPWFEPKIHNFQNSKNISCALPSSLFLILKKISYFGIIIKKRRFPLQMEMLQAVGYFSRFRIIIGNFCIANQKCYVLKNKSNKQDNVIETEMKRNSIIKKM
jgi:hypothetical protein